MNCIKERLTTSGELIHPEIWNCYVSFSRLCLRHFLKYYDHCACRSGHPGAVRRAQRCNHEQGPSEVRYRDVVCQCIVLRMACIQETAGVAIGVIILVISYESEPVLYKIAGKALECTKLEPYNQRLLCLGEAIGEVQTFLM